MIHIQLNKKLKSNKGTFTLDIDFTLSNNELLTIEGHSGAGKTTILRLIAGLIYPDDGRIELDDEIWYDKKKNISLPAKKRKVGFVFQDYALFPNMNIMENLEYGLVDKKDKNYKNEIIDIMEIGDLVERKPDTLSGGQKQRVALARALVRKPKLLLLDEPLSALDTEMRSKLQDYILKIHRKYNLATILVSHDISEIFKMSNKVIRIVDGKIIAHGSVQDVFQEKYISGKFRFIGEVLNIEKDDVVYLVSVLIGNNIVKVIGCEEEIKELQPGDKVIIVSKAFNPLIIKQGFISKKVK